MLSYLQYPIYVLVTAYGSSIETKCLLLDGVLYVAFPQCLLHPYFSHNLLHYYHYPIAMLYALVA